MIVIFVSFFITYNISIIMCIYVLLTYLFVILFIIYYLFNLYYIYNKDDNKRFYSRILNENKIPGMMNITWHIIMIHMKFQTRWIVNITDAENNMSHMVNVKCHTWWTGMKFHTCWILNVQYHTELTILTYNQQTSLT